MPHTPSPSRKLPLGLQRILGLNELLGEPHPDKQQCTGHVFAAQPVQRWWGLEQGVVARGQAGTASAESSREPWPVCLCPARDLASKVQRVSVPEGLSDSGRLRGGRRHSWQRPCGQSREADVGLRGQDVELGASQPR